MKTYKYKLDGLKITCTSVVDKPAIEEPVEFYDKVECFESVGNRIIGPAVIPNKQILRKSKTGEYYNIVFTDEICDFLCSEMFKDTSILEVSKDHDGIDYSDKVRLTGLFQVSEKIKFKDFPDHTIVVQYTVDDPEVLKELTERTGFSVEIAYSGLEPVDKSDELCMLLS